MRLVVVSNRLPFTVSFQDGLPQFKTSAGGLTTGLWSYLDRKTPEGAMRMDFLWMGWPGATIPPQDEPAVRNYAAQYNSSPVFLPEESMDRFYLGFCNKTIWPLFHYFPMLTRYREEHWEEYRNINRHFAEAVATALRPDDILWIHDYHLMLLPRLVREKFPEMPIGFFLHIPFPSWEIFRMLPRAWREEIIEGLLGSSLIAFHTHDYVRDFLTSVLRTAGCEHQLGNITLRDRVVQVETFPMGIEFDRFAEAAASKETELRVEELRSKCVGQKVIFSVDRLDYTKGLINRLRGYELFLKNNPPWRGKVVFVISVAPSRIGVDSYQAMKLELEQTVGRIVGDYGDVHWTPLVYQFRNLTFEEIVPLYRLADVALITPLRDGMNLVAKEFVASRPDQTGVLILSEMAGAAKEMGEALIINPFHLEDFAKALEQALAMPAEEQIRRHQLLQERLRRYNVVRWADDFVQALLSTQKTEAARRARLFTGKAYSGMVQQYRSATRRALLLDYDGTLVPFASEPKLAQPDAELIETLTALGSDPANQIAIISGRPRRTLEEWFGKLPISLIAEHGVWLRNFMGARPPVADELIQASLPAGEWRMIKNMTADWKERVRPILQLYVDRLPGALLEEKDFSLAWHYRRADPEQASLCAKELVDDLSGYTRNIDVQVFEGNKVIELRNSGVNKGSAALEWLAGQMPELILCVGDDWTDEDMFRVLPASAFSVRVGVANTAARYYLNGPAVVRRMLRELSDSRRERMAVLQPA
jgi:trehalose 6-phosphate synthase/phosphatase